MKTTFQKVELTGRWSGKCPVCGKHATRTKKFFQTISPFNKLNGFVKTEGQIKVELVSQIHEWAKSNPGHAKCE